MSNTIIGLVDVNSMYASCETLFRPDWRGRPVVVASNNDGCIVARSSEAKAIGIKMGDPLFKIRDKIKQEGVIVCSSNYTLYGDLSNRIMMTIESMVPRHYWYSIDETFVDLTGTTSAIPLETFCHQIKDRIKKDVGLPVCVGASTTKTLAKLANRAAKKYPATQGVVDLTDKNRQRRLMALCEVGDVWGVGPRLAKRLREMDIHTALDLANASPKTIRTHFSVVLERTVRELNGEACIELDDAPATQQQIVCSRSFGQRVQQKAMMMEALANYTATATARLRQQGLVAKAITIFMRTSPFGGEPQYANSRMATLPIPTDDTRVLLGRVRAMLDRIWRDGYRYAKAGVMLTDFYDPKHLQADLFAQPSHRTQAIMATLDQINAEMPGKLALGSQGVSRVTDNHNGWQMKQSMLSPRYTTRFSDLPVARIG